MDRTKFGMAATFLYIGGVTACVIGLLDLILPQFDGALLLLPIALGLLIQGFFVHAMHEFAVRHQQAQEDIKALLKQIVKREA